MYLSIVAIGCLNSCSGLEAELTQPTTLFCTQYPLSSTNPTIRPQIWRNICVPPHLVEDGESEGDVAVAAGGLILEYARGDADHVPGPAPRLVPLPPCLPVVEREGDARLPPRGRVGLELDLNHFGSDLPSLQLQCDILLKSILKSDVLKPVNTYLNSSTGSLKLFMTKSSPLVLNLNVPDSPRGPGV